MWLVALGFLTPAVRVGAQTCPSQTVTITRPGNGAANLCGTIRIDISVTAAPSGWTGGAVTCSIRDHTGALVESGLCYVINATTYCYNCASILHASGAYTCQATTGLVNQSTQQVCNYQSLSIAADIENPGYTRTLSLPKLQDAFMRDGVCTGSSTSPLTGNQTFTVPVTSWDYKGLTVPFALTYDSIGLTDPQQPIVPNFNGVSERNSHWTHPYAQWIDYARDPNSGTVYAVWHHGNSILAFRNVPASNTWASPDSYHTLTGDMVALPTQTVTCTINGVPVNMPVNVPNSSFILTDEDMTKYEFNVSPVGGEQDLYWQIVPCMALPHYLLSHIIDRWGRTLNVSWTGVITR